MNQSGVADILSAIRMVRVWLSLGWYDLVLQHRRTVIGPFWQSVQMTVWVVGLGLVLGPILGRDGEHYVVYLSAGLALWNFVSSCFTGSAGLLIKHRNLIFNINNPIYLYALRYIVTLTARLGFHLLPYLVLMPFSEVPVNAYMWLAIPGLLTIQLIALWMVPLMAMVGARFRDTRYLVGSVMRFIFLTTPVIWMAEGLGGRAYLAQYNPFAHVLNIVRNPMLGKPPDTVSWMVVGTLTLVGLVGTFLLYRAKRRRLIFWL